MSNLQKINNPEMVLHDTSIAKRKDGTVFVSLIFKNRKEYEPQSLDYINSVGEFIHRHRTAQGLTIVALAKRAGVNKHTIALIECGRHVPMFKNMMIIFEGLKVTLQDYVNYVENKK